MENQPQTSFSANPVVEQQLSPEPVAEKKLLAPVWHTALVVLVLVGNSAVSAIVSSRIMTHHADAITENARLVQYAFTIALEFFLLFLVWIGLRLKQVKIRELIGGRWNTPEAFLIDVAIAFGFWIVAFLVLGGLAYLLGLAKASQIEDTKKLAEMLAPHTAGGLVLFAVLSTVAGFVEEIIFRGYLQRQFSLLTGNVYIGLVLSAFVFGAGHGYEGFRRMVLIFVFGMMFGLVVLWRKSLRPGMMTHALYDASQGVLLFVIARKGFPTMP